MPPEPGSEDEAGESPSLFVARVNMPHDADAMGMILEQDLERMSTLPSQDHYIWDREPPLVRVTDAHTLEVSMRVQDCVDDEWFLTYLLREWTRSHLDACVSVTDQDGEFLLIEAADVLPTWAQPDTTENRVWIYQGELHLVPLDASNSIPLSVDQATCLVRDPTCKTQAPTAVQDKVFARLAAYPGAASTHHHTTLAFVPLGAARILAGYPQSVAEAVHALTTRDVVSMRSTKRYASYLHIDACADEHLAPMPPAVDAVLVRVRCTRHLYARMSFDKFFPPSLLGRRWQHQVEQYRLATSGKTQNISETDAVWGRWCDTGAKLTCGLSMWLESLGQRPTHHPAVSLDPSRHEHFLASLTRLGYFGDEMRDSAEWKAREAQAIKTATRLAAPIEATPTTSISDVLATIRDPVSIPTLSLDTPVSTLASHEDSDAWLSMAPEDVVALLEGRGQEEAEDATMDKFQTFMNKMQTFLESQGDVEGALMEDDDHAFDDGDEAEEDSSDEWDERKNALVDPLPAEEWGAYQHEKSKAQSQGSSARLGGLSKVDHLDGDSDSGSSLEDDEDVPDMTPKEDVLQEQDMHDFIEFTRQTLGLSETQYGEILEERRKRGAFVPQQSHGPLASLDAALDSMERELAQAKRHRAPEAMDDEDELNEEEAELLQHLLASGMSLPDSLKHFSSEHDVHKDDVEMLGDFLESFKAQGGRPGPVGTLSQRLGVGALPRDHP